MHFEVYEDEHERDMRALLEARGMDLSELDNLPSNGFVVYEGDTLYAAGFLRLCEGTTALMDSVITNPELSSLERHLGISMVIEALMDRARFLGLKQVLAFTKDAGILDRAEHHGFQKTPYTVIGYDLTEGENL